MESVENIWDKALGELQLQVNKSNYDTWLRDSRGLTYRDNNFTIGVRNTFVAEWLTKRMYSLIKKTLVAIIGQDISVQFLVYDPGQRDVRLPAGNPADGGTSTKARLHKGNPKYSFNNFVPGDCNRLAYAAAMEVAENPGHRYNPLFIYGEPGQGKTHLLHAIKRLAMDNGWIVGYITAEQFTSEFVLAIKQNQVENFRSKFRDLKLLLLDDIQFFASKKQTQQHLFHIFNELYDNNGQIVITANCAPRNIDVSNNLKSRLEWGLAVPIEAPDFSTRLTILQIKAREMSISVKDQELQLLANQTYGNIRQLEGAIIYLAAQANLTGRGITTEMVNNLLISREGKGNKKSVLQIVAGYFQLRPEDITGKSRNKTTVLARQVTSYVMRQEEDLSFAEIGRILGNRNHATIMHHYNRVVYSLHTSPALQYKLLDIKRQLDSSRG